MTVAPDGTLWMGGWPGPVSFDGATFGTYGDRIAGTGNPATAGGLAITPDGLVWVLVSTVDGRRDDDSVYIITPEAATAAGLDASTPSIVDDSIEADANTPDLLRGVDVVLEEVEPGVQRLTADGFGRDLRGLLAVERATQDEHLGES